MDATTTSVKPPMPKKCGHCLEPICEHASGWLDGLNAAIAESRAENARLTAELALRKDCADQVRAASATITRLARELEVCERPLRAEIARQAERIAELEAHRDGEYERLMDWRGLEPGYECRKCGGAGVRAYGDTATWRGGIGGQMITSDVCDGCWGSGSASCRWPSHRAALAAAKGE